MLQVELQLETAKYGDACSERGRGGSMLVGLLVAGGQLSVEGGPASSRLYVSEVLLEGDGGGSIAVR